MAQAQKSEIASQIYKAESMKKSESIKSKMTISQIE